MLINYSSEHGPTSGCELAGGLPRKQRQPLTLAPPPAPDQAGMVCFTCEEMKAQMWSDLLRARQPAESRARAGPGSRSCQVKG